MLEYTDIRYCLEPLARTRRSNGVLVYNRHDLTLWVVLYAVSRSLYIIRCLVRNLVGAKPSLLRAKPSQQFESASVNR